LENTPPPQKVFQPMSLGMKMEEQERKKNVGEKA
jgi:hypothetical protein